MDRQAEQRRRAAARGTEIRSRRAEVKRSISSGLLSLRKILKGAASDELLAIAGEIRIGELLRSVPGIGPKLSKEILDEARIPSDRRLRDIPDRQRRRIAGEIR